MIDDPSKAIAEQLAKQIPVKEAYNDALSPAMKEAGGALADIVKTLRLALLPLELGGAYYDRISRLIDRSIRNVPEEQRVSPAPQILGPVVEGIKYEEADSPISEMFAALLSRAMNSSEQTLAHPSYPQLIRQLSADEARLLSALRETHHDPAANVRIATQDFNDETHRFTNYQVVEETLPYNVLTHPENMGFYVDHLNSLGLAGFVEVRNQEPIVVANRQTGTRIFSRLQLSPLGSRFMRAVSSAASSDGT